MLIQIPPSKLAEIRTVGAQRAALKQKISDAQVTVDNARLELSELLDEIRLIDARRAKLRGQVAEAVALIKQLRAMYDQLPSAKHLEREHSLPSCTVRQLLAGRNYKNGHPLPSKMRSDNQELAKRNAMPASQRIAGWDGP